MLDSCACDATGETAAEFFGYVEDLSLKDTDPLNAEVWVGENVSSSEEYA